MRNGGTLAGLVEPHKHGEKEPSPTSGLLSPHFHVLHHGKSAPIIISPLIAYVILIFHSVIKKGMDMISLHASSPETNFTVSAVSSGL